MSNRISSKLLGAGTAIAVAAVFSLSAPATADAQAQFGAQGTLKSPDVGDSEFGAGVRVNYMLPNADGIELAGAFNLYFPDGADVGDVWELNAGGVYAFESEGSVSPYAGAGLNFLDGVVGSDTGLNLMGGLKFGSGNGVTPFLEGSYATTGLGAFNITGGFLF